MSYDEIIDLEKKLLTKSVRKSKDKLNSLLAENFYEIGSSGRTYKKADILDRLPKSPYIEINAMEFTAVKIAKNLVQLRFKTKTASEDGTHLISFRSSIWKKFDESWKLIYHQATILKP